LLLEIFNLEIKALLQCHFTTGCRSGCTYVCTCACMHICRYSCCRNSTDTTKLL